jgi:hypothetical protein
MGVEPLMTKVLLDTRPNALTNVTDLPVHFL